MHGSGEVASAGSMWLAAILFVITYGVVMSEKINRAIVALVAAGLMIILGVINQEAAIRGIDFNTIGLLVGMMVIVAITRQSGIFQYLAIWSAKKVNANPWGILVMISLVTATTSAFLDNVTTVLLVVPVTLLITEELKVKPYPLPVCDDLRVQHRRHRHPDRRSAQHHDRLRHRPDLQRFRLRPDAGHSRHHGGHAPPDLFHLGPASAGHAGGSPAGDAIQ